MDADGRSFNNVDTAMDIAAQSNRPQERKPALKFRLVQPNDPRSEILDLAEAAHKETRFGDIPFSKEKAWRAMENAMSAERNNLMAVALVHDKPQGFVFASAGEYVYGTGALLVTINTIHTSQSIRSTLLGGRVALGLLKAVGIWAKGIGAREIMLHATSGVTEKRTGKTALHLGFESVGGTYVAKVR